MRGWLAVRLAGLEVEEQVVPLAGGETDAVKRMSPSGFVPVLEHDGAVIWDSLAIAEYCAEVVPLWPQDRVRRARARAVAAEMHAGFRALRTALPMNLGRSGAPPRAGLAPDVRRDLARIDAILGAAEGPFLFGDRFGAADAAYAPVVTRLSSYGVVPDGAAAYCDAVRHHPLVRAWYEQAAGEPSDWLLPQVEEV